MKPVQVRRSVLLNRQRKNIAMIQISRTLDLWVFFLGNIGFFVFVFVGIVHVKVFFFMCAGLFVIMG